MDFEELLKSARASWDKAKPSLSKSDIKRISGREGTKNVLVGFMSSEYYKRKALIYDGTLTIGYVFKMFLESSEEGAADITPTWVLFSPSSWVENDPQRLKTIANKLQEECADIKTTHLPKKLFYALVDQYADGSYIEIPPEFTNNDLVYLSIANRFRRATPDFKLGYNLLLASRGVSKGILYLPPQYWSEAWNDFYEGKENK